MAHFGRNLKLSIDPARRDAVRRFYEDGFGCERRSPRARDRSPRAPARSDPGPVTPRG